MTHDSRIRRQLLLRQAEGYLDLSMACDDLLQLDQPLKDRLSQKALECLRPLEERHSQLAHVFYLKGQALLSLGRYAGAVIPLEKAAELEDDNTHIFLSLGWCYKRLDRVDLAIESLERALEYDYESAIVHYNLACYWALCKKAKLAVSYLATAFEIDGDCRDLVATERDFDSIRNDPDFLAVTSVIV